jgi:hypothetical protein
MLVGIEECVDEVAVCVLLGISRVIDNLYSKVGRIMGDVPRQRIS